MSNQGLFFNKDTLYRDQNVPLRLDAHTFENALSFFISSSCLQRQISINKFCFKGIIPIVANVLCKKQKRLCSYEFLTQGLLDDILNPILGHANLMQSFDFKNRTPYKGTEILTRK